MSSPCTLTLHGQSPTHKLKVRGFIVLKLRSEMGVDSVVKRVLSIIKDLVSIPTTKNNNMKYENIK
jgi:hypothetical protein